MRIRSDLTYEPERVISIVSPSRAGSTIIKHAFCLHPDVCSLAGEEEPYYKMACNGWPWHSSDIFTEINYPDRIKTYIANEIHNHESPHNRRWMQALHIEEPPFIDLPLFITPRRVLVLKTPQNCYRRGVLESLYPDAKITYVRVLRSKPAIVNGLIDGWETPGAFEARYYSIQGQGDWWKFDMPPGWQSWITESIEERSIYQCEMATEYLNKKYDDAVNISYEDFCQSWRFTIHTLWKHCGLRDHFITEDTELPVLMATDKPDPERWKIKRPHLEKLC